MFVNDGWRGVYIYSLSLFFFNLIYLATKSDLNEQETIYNIYPICGAMIVFCYRNRNVFNYGVLPRVFVGIHAIYEPMNHIIV